MRKNYMITFKADLELIDLIDSVLKKINLKTSIEIKRSDFCRCCIKRISEEIKCGELDSTQFLYSNNH